MLVPVKTLKEEIPGFLFQELLAGSPIKVSLWKKEHLQFLDVLQPGSLSNNFRSTKSLLWKLWTNHQASL